MSVVSVIDDDRDVRESLSGLLRSVGLEVAVFASAAEFLDKRPAVAAACLIVDIRLPDLDGFETFKRLREVQPGVPIILMTGFGWDPSHSIVKARQEGLQTVLYKPFRADRLMEAVEQALRPSGGANPANPIAADGVPEPEKAATPEAPAHGS